MPLTVGTAGHIDHGKTWLVRALTGKDTDRLPEEQERGISIDARLRAARAARRNGSSRSIDVPGHERFVRTMVAGATGIDLFLLVIDAGEGARPQTHEHLAILRLLGIERGVVAVTKADAVDAETLELAVAEAARARPRRRGGRGQRQDRRGPRRAAPALARAAAGVPARPSDAQARLYVDRAFTIPGAGTVVTGTLWSGSIAAGDELRVEPSGLRTSRPQRPGARPARSSGPTRGSASRSTCRGSRARSSSAGTCSSNRAPTRSAGGWTSRSRSSSPCRPLLTVHIGTSDVPARVVREGRYAQLRLREPVVAARGDRVVLRTETTVGGGTVLDPSPPRRFEPQRLELLERGDPESIVRAIVRSPVTGAELQARGLLAPAELAQGLAAVESAGDWFFATEWLERQRTAVRERLAERASASPLDPGIPLGELLPHEPWAPAVLQLLRVERRDGKAYAPGAAPQLGDHATAAAELEAQPCRR